jgi:drug/metabolite transporter (DMT)-like permease
LTLSTPAVGDTRRDAVGGLLVAAASLQFGAVVVLGKGVLERGMTVESMLGYRFGVAALVLAVALLVLRRPVLAAPGERLGLGLLAVVGYSAESAFFFLAAQHGTAASVTLLFFTYPVFVTLASWLLGRGAPARFTIVALVCAVAGAAIVAGTGAGLDVDGVGVVFALASALTFSAYLIGVEHVVRRTSPLTSALWVSAGASAGLFVFAGIAGRSVGPQSGADWWAILGMGVASAGAFVCLLAGLQRIGAVRTAIVSATEPLSAAFLAYVFLDESVSPGTALGGVLILAGAIVASLARATTREQQIP